MDQLLRNDLAEAKRDLARQLALVNGVIVLAAAGASYFLAGKTLAPIGAVMEEQKRFVGDAAHELKTPIAALKTSLEVNLMDKKLGREAKRILRENLEDVENLEELGERLLRLAQVDGKRLSRQMVMVNEVVEKAVRQVRPLASKKRISLKWAKTDEDWSVEGDRLALVELVAILLENAIKYSDPKTEVAIEVGGSKDRVRIEVTDQGMGIAKHHLPHIFERFYRVDAARSKNGGYGLGLAVAKKIASEHDGRIEVESDLGKGSSFRVVLPRAG
jgi:signal transduction histidine kinase